MNFKQEKKKLEEEKEKLQQEMEVERLRQEVAILKRQGIPDSAARRIGMQWLKGAKRAGGVFKKTIIKAGENISKVDVNQALIGKKISEKNKEEDDSKKNNLLR